MIMIRKLDFGLLRNHRRFIEIPCYSLVIIKARVPADRGLYVNDLYREGRELPDVKAQCLLPSQ